MSSGLANDDDWRLSLCFARSERSAANNGNAERLKIIWRHIAVAGTCRRFAYVRAGRGRPRFCGSHWHPADTTDWSPRSLSDRQHAGKIRNPANEIAIELEQARLRVMQVGRIVQFQVGHAMGIVTRV